MEHSPEAMRMAAVMHLLRSLGEDLNREGLVDTPKRVAKMYDEIFAGYKMDPATVLGTVFEEEGEHDLVLVKDIPFYSHCEHHMVPFFGVAHIAYIPDKKVVGISKLARLVECFSRRLQIQERLTKQLAETVMKELLPKGVAVVVTAEHMCMTMRGVQKPGAKTTTSSMLGVFRNEASTRAEVLSLMGPH